MSQIHKFTGNLEGFSWENVVREELGEEGLQSISKTVLIGETEKAQNFFMRYFQVGPNGHSRLERHPQEHEVIVLHGKGQVRIADDVYDVEPFDVVFIEGNELHQFSNMNNESFGFLCIIPNHS